MLFRQCVCPPDRPPEYHHSLITVTQGTFINGYAHGTIVLTYFLDNDAVPTWIFDVNMGKATTEGPFIADNGVSDLTLSTDRVLPAGGIPPFANEVSTNPDLEPPNHISNLP